MDFASIFANVQSIKGFLRDQAPEAQKLRRLPDATVEALTATGVFRMMMALDRGGPELTTLEQLEIIEQISMGDASAGWCAMICCDSGFYSGMMEDSAAERLWPSLDSTQAGWIHPVGRAERVDGGYQLTGSWRFCSGSSFADNIAGGCLLYEDGVPLRINGRKQWRLAIAPRENWTFDDNWHTLGLRGTASRNYRTREDSLFVPEEYCVDLTQPKRPGTMWARPDTHLRKMAGVPLGVARGVIDEVRSLIGSKVEKPSGIPFSALGRLRIALAESEMLLGSARSYVFSSLETQWEKIIREEDLTLRERADVWLSRLNAFQTARHVTRLLFDTLGGDAIFSTYSGLERSLRDTETMCQHVVGQRRSLESMGGLLLGDPVEERNILYPK